MPGGQPPTVSIESYRQRHRNSSAPIRTLTATKTSGKTHGMNHIHLFSDPAR